MERSKTAIGFVMLVGGMLLLGLGYETLLIFGPAGVKPMGHYASNTDGWCFLVGFVGFLWGWNILRPWRDFS